ncbi:class I tRNA ligase family protein [bacterium]|nr:class I tRNA ligase family protein [bacterium]
MPIKENKEHVIYVWFDALFNYLTNLDFATKKCQNFTKY